MALGADWGRQCAAEGVNDWREATHGLVWSAKVELHQLLRVVGQETELLLASHGVVTSAKELTCDSGLIKRLGELSGGRVVNVISLVRNMAAGRLESEGLELGLALVVGCVADVDSLVILRPLDLLLVKGGQHVVALGLDVHHAFNCLFLGLGLALVEGSVHDMSVDALELAELKQVDFDVSVLTEELADDLEDVQHGLMVHALLHIGVFGHDAPVWLNQGAYHNLGVLEHLNHLTVPMQTVGLHKRLV